MPSVLHICTDFWPSTGGIEQFVLELASRTAATGVRTAVLCLNRTKSHPSALPARDTVRGIPVHRVGFIDLKFYKPSALPLSLLRQYDILHVHGPGALLDWTVLTKALHQRAIVLSTHGGIFHTPALARLKQLYFYGFQRFLLPFVDAVVACSRDDEALFRCVTSRVSLLENAIDAERFLALSPDAKEPGRCLYAGRLAPNKALPDLLRAFAHAGASNSRCRLRLVGRDVDGTRAQLERLACQLGMADRVTFVGEVSDIELLREFETAHLFLSASRYEGFGLSAVEAKAAGCRLVLHANSAFTQLFSADRQAKLVDFLDAKRAGEAILAALEGNDQLSLQSSRHEVAVYSWRTKLNEWLELYRQLAHRMRERLSAAR